MGRDEQDPSPESKLWFDAIAVAISSLYRGFPWSDHKT